MTTVGAQLPRWGPHAEAPGMLALWQRHDAGEIDFVAQEHGLVVALTPIEGRQTRLGGARGPAHFAPAGSINVIPAGADHWGRWGERKESAYFALSPAKLDAVAVQHFERDRVELIACNRPRVDPVLLRFAGLLRAELAGGGLLTELAVDALGSLIMVHMLRRYSSLGGVDLVGRARRGGLTPHVRRAVLDTMADRHAERLTVAELAAVARLAPSSFLRAFKQELGVTPHQHLLQLRVDAAERLLCAADLTLAEVALACGFSSQSHLTTAFGKLKGTTPAALRRNHS